MDQSEKLKVANDNSKEAYEDLRIELEALNEVRKQGFKEGTTEFELLDAQELQVKMEMIKCYRAEAFKLNKHARGCREEGGKRG